MLLKQLIMSKHFAAIKSIHSRSIDIDIMMDRTTTIRTSLHDVEFTLIIAMLLSYFGHLFISRQHPSHVNSWCCCAFIVARYICGDEIIGL